MSITHGKPRRHIWTFGGTWGEGARNHFAYPPPTTSSSGCVVASPLLTWTHPLSKFNSMYADNFMQTVMCTYVHVFPIVCLESPSMKLASPQCAKKTSLASSPLALTLTQSSSILVCLANYIAANMNTLAPVRTPVLLCT